MLLSKAVQRTLRPSTYRNYDNDDVGMGCAEKSADVDATRGDCCWSVMPETTNEDGVAVDAAVWWANATPQIIHAVQIIEQAFDEYSMEQLALSFNGGKDCTVLLHLLYHVCRSRNLPMSKLTCLYFVTTDCFPEIDQFVQSCCERYGVTMVSVDKSIRKGLEEQVDKGIKAVFTGTRRSDPGGETLDFFKANDPGWPKLMRVFPILDWTYSDVWDFFRIASVPYCSLYDLGYTSLGNRSNTLKNPLLLRRLPDGTATYYPAYMLRDEAQERLGRPQVRLLGKSPVSCTNL
ncbi:FAD synthase [Pelomyxa schiedti]|nr:FAD synthase [Pelomyxa schiedti]